MSTKLSQTDIAMLHLAKERIERDPVQNSNLTVLAKSVGLYRRKLADGFQEQFNISPYEFVLQQKIEKSKFLLTHSDYSIKEISVMVGYKIQNSFTREFIKQSHVSPTEYRQQTRQSENAA